VTQTQKAKALAAQGMFRALGIYNYRVWASGAALSNIGTWMQRTAQDWLVLTELTQQNATAVGIVVALQFAPQILLLPWTGTAADTFDRRKLLMITQAAMALLALGLGTLIVTGLIALWHAYVFAFLLGCVAAFDAPARQTFVSDLVSEADLSNAVALNSTSFNAARMIGPAIAGLLIAEIGTGWVFLLNAISFVPVIFSLLSLRKSEMTPRDRLSTRRGSLMAGFRYVTEKPELRTVLIMLFLIGTFGIHFPIFISTMATSVFHVGARQYGLLTSMMALGSVIGTLLAARRSRPTIRLLLTGVSFFGCGWTVAALAPNYWFFGLTLTLIGISSQTFTTSTLSLVQLATDPSMRGRVVAIALAIALGGTPLGAPLIGWTADLLGPRWALGIGAAAGFGAALVALLYLFRQRKKPEPKQAP